VADPPTSLQAIRDALPPAREVPGADAAVLAPLYGEPPDLDLLLTRRRDDLDSHPGQVSFPGGRVEAEDRDHVETALREAREEVGVRREDVEVLGGITDFETYRGDHLVAYVGAVAGDPPTEPVDRTEVAGVFTVRWPDLLEADAYESRVSGRPDREGRVHYWHLPQGTLWGITGYLVAQLLERVSGWHPPDDPKVVDEADGFQP
jgi:8-oxo-dGTP pyrophosphatase MutT (NUDIX family)